MKKLTAVLNAAFISLMAPGFPCYQAVAENFVQNAGIRASSSGNALAANGAAVGRGAASSGFTRSLALPFQNLSLRQGMVPANLGLSAQAAAGQVSQMAAAVSAQAEAVQSQVAVPTALSAIVPARVDATAGSFSNTLAIEDEGKGPAASALSARAAPVVKSLAQSTKDFRAREAGSGSVFSLRAVSGRLFEKSRDSGEAVPEGVIAKYDGLRMMAQANSAYDETRAELRGLERRYLSLAQRPEMIMSVVPMVLLAQEVGPVASDPASWFWIKAVVAFLVGRYIMSKLVDWEESIKLGLAVLAAVALFAGTGAMLWVLSPWTGLLFNWSWTTPFIFSVLLLAAFVYNSLTNMDFRKASQEYAAAHTQLSTQLTHIVGIPFILQALVYWTQISSLPGLLAYVPWVSVFLVLQASWSPKLAAGMAVVLAAMAAIATVMPGWLAWAFLILGIILQGVGHKGFEKNQPKLFENLLHMLIGPLWILKETPAVAKEVLGIIKEKLSRR